MEAYLILDKQCEQANEIWKFIRDKDSKEYYITFHSHWSEIKPLEGNGETYHVKWIGGTGKHGGSSYVSTYGELFSKVRRDGKAGE